MSKRFLYIVILIFITSCSFSSKKNEINDGKTLIFEKIEPIKKEFNSDLKIKSLINFKNRSFLNNKTNSNGNINFDTNFTKISSYKFRKIKKQLIVDVSVARIEEFINLIYDNNKNLQFYKKENKAHRSRNALGKS